MPGTVVDETWSNGKPKKDHVERDDGKVTERREYDEKGKKTKKLNMTKKEVNLKKPNMRVTV